MAITTEVERHAPGVQADATDVAPTVSAQGPERAESVVASRSTPGAEETAPSAWKAHPILSRLVRLVVLGVPLGASLAAAVTASRLIPRGGGWLVVGHWLGTLVVSSIVMLVVGRISRRLLPLAMLLQMSLIFPDQVPKRFSAALRAGSTRRINRQLTQAADASDRGRTPTDTLKTILVLLGTLAAHDPRTRGHSERVRALSDLVAEELKLSRFDQERLRWAAILHDIGKLHIHSRVLNKPGKLDAAEWRALKEHPELGARIVEPLRNWLGDWVDAVGDHHERFDGHGYPHGLAGSEISLGGRIVAVVDAFEVMTSVRAYKRPVSAEAARKELVRCSGEHFDPAIVRAFLRLSIGKLRAIIGPLSLLGQIPIIGGIPQIEGIAVAAGRQAAASSGALAAAGAIVAGTAIGTPASFLVPAGASSTPPVGSSIGAQTGAPAQAGSTPGVSGAPSDGSDTSGSATTQNALGTPLGLSSALSGIASWSGVGAGLSGTGIESSGSPSSVSNITSGDSGTAPGLSGAAPGLLGGSPGNSGSSPGNSGSSPGQSGTAPGLAGTAPGLSGGSPGNSGSSPGQSGTAPGLAGTAPGLSGASPGNSGSSPGNSVASPGNSGSSPGHSGH